jgi:hypothetical protein
MAVEDPELGALVLAPVPLSDVAAFGLKKGKDGLRRRLGLLPELPKTAEAGEKFGGQLRLALTSDDRAQLADLKRRADAAVARARFIDSTG